MKDVEEIASRHKHALWEHRCTAGQCLFVFQIYNTWLSRLKLEPAAMFRADVRLSAGTVESIGIVLARATQVFPTSDSAGRTEEYRRFPDPVPDAADQHYWFPTPVGKPYLRVALDAGATPEQREHAYAYSLKCLVKPGRGCDLPCDYLPLAWKDWQAELKKSGFGADGFGPFYPERARCQ